MITGETLFGLLFVGLMIYFLVLFIAKSCVEGDSTFDLSLGTSGPTSSTVVQNSKTIKITNDIISGSEKFYESPSGKYKLITWNQSSGGGKKKSPSSFGRIFADNLTFPISNIGLDFITFCWLEDCEDGHDYFVYQSFNQNRNTSLYSICLDTGSEGKQLDPPNNTHFIDMLLSPDKKKIAMVGFFSINSVKAVPDIDIHFYDIKFDNGLSICHSANMTNSLCYFMKWRNDNILDMTLMSEYDKKMGKYQVEMSQAEKTKSTNVYGWPKNPQIEVDAEYNYCEKRVVRASPTLLTCTV